MSIAWGSLVLLILLLPGLLFFVGALLPEKFTRDAEQRSPLGQLGGALLIAFFVHGVYYLALSLASTFVAWIPRVDVAGFLIVLNASPGPNGGIAETEVMMRAHALAIFLYVLLTCAGGVGLGWAYGWLVSQRGVTHLTKHPWLYDLDTEGYTYAHVMSNVKEGERVLMYKGFLRWAGLRVDGRFSYLILRDVTRYYMRLEKDAPVTSDPATHKVIGETASQDSDPKLAKHTRVNAASIFFIEGEDIANAFFQRLAMKTDLRATSEFERVVIEEQERLFRLLETVVAPSGARHVSKSNS